MNDPGRVVILGAGPTGLGGAFRLRELGYDAYQVVEQDDRPGGLARSYVDGAGFTWDCGGHVQFSHYAYYDALCDRAVGDAWLDHERESWIWIKGRFVPYPFQNNVHRLDAADRDRALAGLERAAAGRKGRPSNFREWIVGTFGEEFAEILAVRLSERVVELRDGRRIPFDALISSIPLDTLCALSTGLPEPVRLAGRALVYSAVHVLGVGLRGPKPETLARKCWMYFPEPHSPYYRVTVFSNYSPHNAPPGDDHWSLMAEVSETPEKPVRVETLRDDALAAMRRDGLLGGAEVVSFWHRREEHGYPTPFLGRDETLARMLAGFEACRVYSRGRFGAWKYEVSNQDHSCMQGVELVDRLLGVGEGDEPTLNRPDHVNGGAFAARPRGGV